MRYLPCLLIRSSMCFALRQRRIGNLVQHDKMSEFKTVLPKIVEETLRRQCINENHLKDIILENAAYNITHGNNPSSMILLHARNVMNDSQCLTPEAHYQSLVLAWSLELTQSYILLMNNKENNNYIDKANMIRSFLNVLLEVFFKNVSYVTVQKMFNKAFFYLEIGKYLDNQMRQGKYNRYANFDTNNYIKLCEYKVSYNTFKLPLCLSTQLGMLEDKTLYENLNQVTSQLGQLYQMQVEYKDCFGTETINNRIAGSHIQQGKCTWLAVMALQLCTAAQRTVFTACYSSNQPAHIERIKLLYEQLGIPQLYLKKEDALCESIMKTAKSIENEIPPIMFSDLVQVICNKNII